MKLIPAIKDRLVRWQYARTTRALERAESTHIQDMAERNLLKAFQLMAEEVPAHKQLLRSQGIDPKSVDSIDAFKSMKDVKNEKKQRRQKPEKKTCTVCF